MRIKCPANVSVSGPGRRIYGCHAAIAKCRCHHGKHGDQNCRDRMAIGEFLSHPEEWNRGRRLNQDKSIKDQIPKRQDSSQAWGRALYWGSVVRHKPFGGKHAEMSSSVFDIAVPGVPILFNDR